MLLAALLVNVPVERPFALVGFTAFVLMIPLAAAMFWVFLLYLERLFPLVKEVQPMLRTE